MSDAVTTIAEIKELVRAFVDQRDWRQFHSPKNLAMSAAIEAAELMEHFQWLSAEESRQVAAAPAKLAAVADELADVLCYCTAMANELGIDLSTAVRQKMQKNALKYPADQYRGRWGAEDSARGPEENASARGPEEKDSARSPKEQARGPEDKARGSTGG